MNMARIGFLSIALLVGGLAVGGATPALESGDDPAAIGYDSALFDAAPAFGVDCADCQNCLDESRHQLENGTLDRRRGESNHNCISQWGSGTCNDRHSGPGCGGGGGTDEEFEALTVEQELQVWTVATTGGADELAATLQAFGDAVRFNPDRQAIQVLTCDGNVRLSVPVSTEIASELL
jgi:hypothetical protein